MAQTTGQRQDPQVILLFRELVNIGHRGASAYAPEHTIAAYDLALAQGAHYLELDVHMTADSRLVVVHDESLERTGRSAGGVTSGLIKSMTLEELRALDFGSWFNEVNAGHRHERFVGSRILSLEEVLTRYRHIVKFCIEIKGRAHAGAIEGELLRVLARFDLDRPHRGGWRALVMSLSSPQLRTIHSLHAHLPLIQICNEFASSAEIQATLADVSTFAVGIAPPQEAVDGDLVTAAHERALKVHPYTVNAAADMERLLCLGVDGLITDFPDRLDHLVWARVRGS
jgi:glycerophosphoryl diester phosphodiesterase